MSEIASARISITDDEEEVEIIHDRQDLLNKAKRASKKPSYHRSCCKAFVIAIAIVVFIAMMVQIWSDYGEYIQTSTFPPKIVSMSSQCPDDVVDNCMKKNYKAPDCTWSDKSTLLCKMIKPEYHMVNVDHPTKIMHWDEGLNITFEKEIDHCVHVIIWSI